MKDTLIEKLLQNDISIGDLDLLSDMVDEWDLADIIQSIYDLNESSILGMAAVTGLMKYFDNSKNTRRNDRFTQKVKSASWTRKSAAGQKVILAEGDSWFNYPVILSDVVDTIATNEDYAVYSLALGGAWLLDILEGRKYVEELSTLSPDIFLMSGGGNDIVGARRLAAVVQPKPSLEQYHKNPWAQLLIDRVLENMENPEMKIVRLERDRFYEGVQYLSKDFFALLMFFRLQYHFLFRGILLGGGSGKPSKFPGIKILTQGYDFVIPSLNKGFGWNPLKWYIPFVRLFLGHGSWLKIPLKIRGITHPEVQRNICYAMIFLFNEMMIERGAYFNELCGSGRVFHIDSRDSVGVDGWTDELHAQPKHFINTGRAFDFAIRRSPAGATYEHVYVVKFLLEQNVI